MSESPISQSKWDAAVVNVITEDGGHVDYQPNWLPEVEYVDARECDCFDCDPGRPNDEWIGGNPDASYA